MAWALESGSRQVGGEGEESGLAEGKPEDGGWGLRWGGPSSQVWHGGKSPQCEKDEEKGC